MRSEKRCPRCERTLPLSDFNKNRRNAGGLSGWCTVCHRLYTRNYMRDYRAGRERKRRTAARQRRNKHLLTIKRYLGISDEERHELRLLAVENAMRVEHDWFDQILNAEEQADG